MAVLLIIGDLTERFHLVPHHGGHPPLGQGTRAMCDIRDLLPASPLPLFSEAISGG